MLQAALQLFPLLTNVEHCLHSRDDYAAMQRRNIPLKFSVHFCVSPAHKALKDKASCVDISNKMRTGPKETDTLLR